MSNSLLVSRRAMVCLLLGLSLFLLPAAMQAQSLFFTPPPSCALFVADFNGDGKPDQLCDGMIMLGNGDGTFTTGASIPGIPLAVADFNGDGKSDILEQGTGTLLVLLGNGDGTFQPAISTPSGASLTTIVVGDLNGDGKSDVVGIFNNNLLVYVSNGDGTFAAGVSYSLGSSINTPLTTIFGDFNGDGKLDVAVITTGNNVAGQIIVFPGKGDGTLQSALISSGVYGSPQSPYVVAGDFNGDGKLDLAVNVFPICNGTCVGTNNVSILLGNGDGTFQAPTVAFSGSGPLAAADFNGDGKLDLAFGNGPLIQIYLGNGDGTFLATKSYHCSPGVFGSAAVIVADFNLDGKPDIAAGGFVLLGNGDGTFQGWPAVIVPGNFIGVATGDFDKNGTQDVAEILSTTVGSTTTYSVNILLSDSTGTPNLTHTYSLQQSPVVIASADLNGDGNLDLVIAGNDPTTQNWSYTVLLGNGDGSFQPPVPYVQNVMSSAGQVILTDFNNDHKPDIAIVLANQNVEVLLGNGDGTFGTPTSYFDNGGETILIADFNSDGNLDLAVSGGSGSTAETAILYGKGDGTFQPAIFPLGEFAALFTGDFNNDGKADLLGEGENAQLLLGNGDGTFNGSSPFTLPPNYSGGPYFDLLADINGDGNLDVVGFLTQGDTDQSHGVYLGNGNGTFSALVPIIQFSGLDLNIPRVLSAADFNGDGKPDLLIQEGFSNTGSDFYVLINTTAASQSAGAKLSTPSLTFPSTSTGSSSSAMSVTVTNTGKGTLSVTGVSIGGAQASQFSQTNNCATVQPTASCTINAVFSPTVAGNAAASLTITDNAVSGTQTVALSGVATAPPSFSVGSGSGSPTSQTISAGQSAKFSLAITPTGGFTGAVSLSCAVSPVSAAGPTCSLSSSSLQVSGGTAAPVTVTVGTTATTTTGTMSNGEFPPGAMRIMWTAMLLSSGWLFLLWNRKRLPGLAMPLIVLALASGMGCGGNSPKTTTTTTTGTAAGTYTATVTATSGSVSQTMALTIIVQ